MNLLSQSRRNAIIVGSLIAVGSAAIIWQLTVSLLPTEAILIPRLSFAIIGLGGVVLALQAATRPTVPTNTKGTDTPSGFLLIALLVLTSLGLAGYLLQRLGIASTSFLFLLSWWVALTARSRTDSLGVWRLLLLCGFGALLAFLLYAFSIYVLRLYLPGTLFY